MSEQQPVISATNLSRNFGKLVAVSDVSLSIPQGVIYGFLGPNGSGKSTTIRMLCGLLTPTSGTASVMGLDSATEAEKLKQKIGYMTQRFSLYEDLSIIENLKFVGEVYAVPAKERKIRIQQLLADFDLEQQSRQRAGTLSGGQKQRLALAAAILHKPQVLFLDEPTSAVDPQNRRDFWSKLFELADAGTTILVSTHYMDEAERCHRLAILQEGVKVADGSPTDLSKGIAFNVVEVTAEAPNQARQALSSIEQVSSVTQLGLRLRALISKQVDNPAALIQRHLEIQAVTASAAQVTPSLEDVFVAVTEQSNKQEIAA